MQALNNMETNWVPGVNYLGAHGRWAFAEFTDVWEMHVNFEAEVRKQFDRMIDQVAEGTNGEKDEVLK